MSIFAAALLGGILSIDVTAAFQVMISRPIFCAPLFGYLFGDIEAGISVGIIMELLWIAVVPLGNAVPPDSTVVAVTAVYVSSMTRGELGAGYIAFLILVLVPFGILFKKADIYHRQKNNMFLHYVKQRIRQNDCNAVNRVTYLSLLIFMSKTFVFLLIMMQLAIMTLPSVYGFFPERIKTAFDFLLYLLPAIGLGTALQTLVFKKISRNAKYD